MHKVKIPKRPKKARPMQVPCSAEAKKRIVELSIQWGCNYIQAVARILAEHETYSERGAA
jgi:hypothetical protein